MPASDSTWQLQLEPELQTRLALGWRLITAVEQEHAMYLWRTETSVHALGAVHRLLTGAKRDRVVTIRLRLSDEGNVLVEAVH